MKRLLIYILFFVAAASAKTNAATGDLFIYPVAPDTVAQLQQRCDYIVSRFWDRCNFDRAMLAPEKFNTAFGDWVSLMPYASADTVYNAVNALMARFAKKGPIAYELATMAENWLYSDTASMRSDDVYSRFARAAVANKKIGKAEKARFSAHLKIIDSSSLGATVPAVPFIRPDGTTGTLDDITTKGSIVLFFNDPDCMDCLMARVRLSSSPDANSLIEKEQLTIVSIYPGEADDEEWKKACADAPANWVTVAMPEAAEYFRLDTTPAFYFLNSRRKVLRNDADLTANYLIEAFHAVNQAK